MEAYTRCPSCDATYQLEVHELAEAAGVVRCSNCGKTFNSLAQLFEFRPDEQDQPLRGGGMPPLLKHRIYLQHEIPGLDEAALDELTPPQASSEQESTDSPEGPVLPAPPPDRSWIWGAVAVVLLLGLVGQAVWLFEMPERLYNLEASDTAAPQDAIALIARDLHAHPSMDGAVIISATLRNRISTSIKLPLIELRMYDSTNQVLGARRFLPEDYLPAGRMQTSSLSPGEDLPIILEVLVTGSQPAGFEFLYFENI
ncbi:MAG: zinc-ribbon and DUF3426 domain-containing protein [Wenzhouxiangella sp.]|nr:zinc-ribbon and DUF3426 domain-containing protein [Wenzhouxiangella sp.]